MKASEINKMLDRKNMKIKGQKRSPTISVQSKFYQISKKIEKRIKITFLIKV
mgnify:CR=1 FL=1